MLIGIAFGLGSLFNNKIVYKQVEKEVILDNLKAKINQLKGELILSLRNCESSGYKESDGLVTFDGSKTNKKVEIPSFGLYQFKKSTVIYFYKSLYNKDISGYDAVLIALDEEKSSQLTSDIVFKIDGSLGANWYNCTKKYNLQGRLDIINSLSN